MAMLTLLEVLDKSTAYLDKQGIERPKFEAQLLLAHVLQTDRLQLFMQFDRPLGEDELAALREPLRRRGQGEPYAYIVGSQEFWSLDFAVGAGVLIPRPDTETLVEQALKLLPEDQELFVADVCAGTGCVGIALASERPGLKVYATELSEDAIGLLRTNVKAHGLDKRVAVLRGDLLSPIPEHRRIDVVVSNPPYIASGELAGLAVSRFEPRQALDGGRDGLDIYRRLVPEAARRAEVAVLMEIGHDQGAAVSALFEKAGLRDVQVIRDLGGNDRVVLGISPRSPGP
jgi:release factor glutamine methyltransferase